MKTAAGAGARSLPCVEPPTRSKRRPTLRRAPVQFRVVTERMMVLLYNFVDGVRAAADPYAMTGKG